MKKRNLLGLALVAALGLAACGDKINSDDITIGEPQSRVRAVHLSPDAPAVDVLVDGARVLSGVTYTQASGYLGVPAGTTRIQVNAAGTSTSVIDATLDLQPSQDYTVIATDFLADITPLVLEDDNTAPSSGNIKVRIVHGAPSAPEVDVYITAPGADINTATPVLEDVPFQAVSDYIEAPAGSYQIRVTPAGTKTVVIDSGTVPLAAGQIRTVVARDATGGGGPFGAVVLADAN